MHYREGVFLNRGVDCLALRNEDRSGRKTSRIYRMRRPSARCLWPLSRSACVLRLRGVGQGSFAHLSFERYILLRGRVLLSGVSIASVSTAGRRKGDICSLKGEKHTSAIERPHSYHHLNIPSTCRRHLCVFLMPVAGSREMSLILHPFRLLPRSQSEFAIQIYSRGRHRRSRQYPNHRK